MFAAIAAGQAASSVLCAANDCQLLLVDVGVDGDLLAEGALGGGGAHIEGGRHILHRKVKHTVTTHVLQLSSPGSPATRVSARSGHFIPPPYRPSLRA